MRGHLRGLRGPRRTTGPVTVAMCLAGALLTGCSSADEPAADPPSDTGEAGPEGAASGGGRLRPRIALGTVTGRMRPVVARRNAVKVARVVDSWFEAAYVGGTFPRESFTGAFPGFTEGAVRAARRDRRLMSNVAIADDVGSVVAGLKRIEVDLLGVARRPVGGTARFRLVFTTTAGAEGSVTRRVAVTGKLFLTKGPADNWRVFGYEVRRAASGPAQAAAGGGS